MARPVSKLELDATQRRELQRIVGASTSAVREVRRARIILLRAEGKAQAEVAEEVQVNRPVVALWERRFRQQGMAGLHDAKGRGRKSTLSQAKVARVLEEAVRAPAGRQRWSVRTMARHAKVSAATVQRLWNANDIKPHLTRTFKLSTDRDFEAKFWDVIGLYLNPPDKALVLCCDEKTQCQALERTQPGLPLGIGHIRTRTHDYIRHGTITLFAALSYLDGKILSRLAPRQRIGIPTVSRVAGGLKPGFGLPAVTGKTLRGRAAGWSNGAAAR